MREDGWFPTLKDRSEFDDESNGWREQCCRSSERQSAKCHMYAPSVLAVFPALGVLVCLHLKTLFTFPSKFKIYFKSKNMKYHSI